MNLSNATGRQRGDGFVTDEGEPNSVAALSLEGLNVSYAALPRRNSAMNLDRKQKNFVVLL